MMKKEATNPYRLLPSVEEVLSGAEVRSLAARVERGVLAGFVAEVIARWRAEIGAGLDAAALQGRLERGELARAVRSLVEGEEQSGIVRAVNATGVVLHTGLGRAPLHPEAARAMGEVAGSYAVLEVDRASGERNQRDERLGVLLARLTGAEAGIAVNNNAAAVLLLLNTFAAGRETIVSRGELVEIGGSFRMPDVMARAGTKLVEVGTTNRTRIADFRRATSGTTGLLLKVHTSNFRQIGFTEEASGAELAALGGELGIASAFDLGSGLLERSDLRPLDGLIGEPLVEQAVASGVDVVTFSGDKLLGGPQAGLLVGKKGALAKLRANPLYRALRLDKVTIAGLEATLALVLAGRGDELPARAMLRASAAELKPVAERIARALSALGLKAEVVPERSQPGSGSAPGVFLDTFAVRVRATSAMELAERLRRGEPPVFARIHEGALLVDPRTLLPGDEELLTRAFAQALGERA